MKSVFLIKQGDIPKNRIWDFLIVNQEYDYSMKDIAKFSKVSYSSLKRVWGVFKRDNLVVHTRTIGNAKLYKLNLKNPVVSRFIDYFWSVVESEVEASLTKKHQKAKEDYAEGALVSAPMSASHL